MAEVQSILEHVEEFNLVTAISKKTEKPYQILELKLKTGLKSRFFLDYRDMQALLEQVEKQNKEESKFNLDDEK